MGWSVDIFGINVGNASPEGMADTWINQNYNAGFNGTLAALQSLINSDSTACAAAVHKDAQGISNTAAYSICQPKVRAKYGEKLNRLQGDQQILIWSINTATEAAAKGFAAPPPAAGFLSPQMIMAGIAIIVIVILLLI